MRCLRKDPARPGERCPGELDSQRCAAMRSLLARPCDTDRAVTYRRRERSASDEDEEEVAQSSNAVNADDLDYSAQDAKARRRAELDAQIAAATKAGKKRPRKKKGDEIVSGVFRESECQATVDVAHAY